MAEFSILSLPTPPGPSSQSWLHSHSSMLVPHRLGWGQSNPKIKVAFQVQGHGAQSRKPPCRELGEGHRGSPPSPLHRSWNPGPAGICTFSAIYFNAPRTASPLQTHSLTTKPFVSTCPYYYIRQKQGQLGYFFLFFYYVNIVAVPWMKLIFGDLWVHLILSQKQRKVSNLTLIW